jgi:hypothetical protein
MQLIHAIQPAHTYLCVTLLKLGYDILAQRMQMRGQIRMHRSMCKSQWSRPYRTTRPMSISEFSADDAMSLMQQGKLQPIKTSRSQTPTANAHVA